MALLLLSLFLWMWRPPPPEIPAFVLPIGRGAMRGLMGRFHKAKWQPLPVSD